MFIESACFNFIAFTLNEKNKLWTLMFDTVKDMVTVETENNVAAVDNFKLGGEKDSGRK